MSWIFAAGLLLVLRAATPAADAASEIRYNRDIRPILSENCFQCHGPDKGARKAKLRLDVRDDALAAGAFVPGQPEASELIKRLFSTDADETMPPPSSHKTLTPEQRELLRGWIAGGASYEAHWAYLPIERPRVPEVGSRKPAAGIRESEVRTPVDAFVLEALTKAGLEPAPEADRRTLLRRLSLDLTGLPPTPAELDEFERDRSRHAYEKQVGRLLASPHFGERMAVPWLDAVRFADTVGYHGDQNQRIFPYRDYVIGAFNANLPFDRFTTEQIAGDLLPDPTPAQLTASGFNRLNMVTREGGAQPKEYLAKYQADRTRTVSTAWLGSTMACAECHDHKYDPFTMRDFYSLSAFFADLRQWGVYADYGYTPNPDLRGVGNDHSFPPEIEIESPALRARIAKLESRIRDVALGAKRALRTNENSRATAGTWRSEAREFLKRNPGGWAVPGFVRATRGDGTNRVELALSQAVDGALGFADAGPSTDRVEFRLAPGPLAALRIELLPDPARSNRVLRSSKDSTTIDVAVVLRRADGGEDKLPFRFASANFSEPRFAGSHDILGVHRGWQTSPRHVQERHDSVWLLDQPQMVGTNDTLVLTLKNNAAASIRVSASPLALEPERDNPVAGYDRLRGRLPEGDTLAVLHLRSTGFDSEAFTRLRGLQKDLYECRDGRAWTMVSASTNSLVTRVLPRGNWMDESGPVVEPSTPHFLPPTGRPPGLAQAAERDAPGGDAAPDPSDRRLTRLDFARWLVSPKNPLTARNFVNRLWAQFFGTGISGRIEDLGLQGDWPTHPELLDWLAAEFMQPSGRVSPLRTEPEPHRWDVKHLVRVLVLSSTYRQSSEPSKRALEDDPSNRLYARQNPRRLEAEFVRDNALAAAGLLNLEIGGPSAFPYQPPGYYANLQFPDRDYVPNADDRQYRRGIYSHWQRTFLHPMLANFDAQSREECVASRIQSNTPQQALTLLNDPTFVEAGRAFAEAALRGSHNDTGHLRFLFERAVGRSPKPAERESLTRFLDEQRNVYRADTASAGKLLRAGAAPVAADVAPAELAAWSNVARVILNLHETITRY